MNHAQLRVGNGDGAAHEAARKAWIEEDPVRRIYELFRRYYPEIPRSQYRAALAQSMRVPEDTNKRWNRESRWRGSGR